MKKHLLQAAAAAALLAALPAFAQNAAIVNGSPRNLHAGSAEAGPGRH
jgi:hypothetical protein